MAQVQGRVFSSVQMVRQEFRENSIFVSVLIYQGRLREIHHARVHVGHKAPLLSVHHSDAEPEFPCCGPSVLWPLFPRVRVHTHAPDLHRLQLIRGKILQRQAVLAPPVVVCGVHQRMVRQGVVRRGRVLLSGLGCCQRALLDAVELGGCGLERVSLQVQKNVPVPVPCRRTPHLGGHQLQREDLCDKTQRVRLEDSARGALECVFDDSCHRLQIVRGHILEVPSVVNALEVAVGVLDGAAGETLDDVHVVPLCLLKVVDERLICL
mmetsp:Transcript_24991/g.48914  ORF Transcript_24991/g.48914 Transcript_24991/m.48914 type:complete len:266 (-) Transcript_24991:1329-2126(-)